MQSQISQEPIRVKTFPEYIPHGLKMGIPFGLLMAVIDVLFDRPGLQWNAALWIRLGERFVFATTIAVILFALFKRAGDQYQNKLQKERAFNDDRKMPNSHQEP